ncbi:MAG: DUF4249 domain-containing protein [Muricauda sp.]|jgi:hypothetical protein|nr:DUF4249 family protein [Allomuricauda sp.]MBO6589062.1 DUF4249 domain-containing protein [Allomuricauda sp.]MBO6618687.1 DUF4249 domain-containing protein [Allomuricauda sp.]MBO6644600.1 DUF4249 domain-containing protein [Allomuricauda sp.]MBO6746500.1 DUF4249 domain-containing protein [Allomuricauda sp.]MBO6843416.1 DUF4249 domain-containing protein [Allomuricauda sp.]
MKQAITILLCAILFFSCEDTIDVDLPEVETRLIVDGLVRVDKSQELVDVKIKLRESSNFFEENQPTQAESVLIYYGKPTSGGLFEDISFSTLVEKDLGSGIYVPNLEQDQIRTAFVEPGVVFILQITHQGKRYYAQTEYAPTVPIDNLEQGTDTFLDEEETEIIVTFTDNGDEDNFYLFDFMNSEFLVVEDEFFQGQQFSFSYFYDDEVTAGETVTVSILGATEEFYNYMDLVLEQTENNGGVFQTPVATVRGNVFDITGLDNINLFDNVERPNDYALGYFAMVQEYTATLTIP